jgi:hypothetical protein
MRSLRFTLTVASILAATSALHAQSTYATVTGVVSDSAGALVPNVEIEGVEAGSGYRYTTRSNESGNYTLPQLREGTYRITAKSPGLAEFVAEGIGLKSRDVRRVDITLSVAAVGTTVEVSGAGP